MAPARVLASAIPSSIFMSLFAVRRDVAFSEACGEARPLPTAWLNKI